MAWRIEKQSNGKFAIWSTTARDYIVVDADASHIEEIYAAKGVEVYLASARAQIAKEAAVPPAGEALIEAARARGGPAAEPPEKIGRTGFRRG